MQPSSLGNAVVEHKAQTHLRGFALVSRYFRASYLAARVYFNGGHVRHHPARPARAEKAQKASSRRIGFSRVFSLKVVVSRAFSRLRAVPSAPASVKALRYAPPAAAALRGLD